MYLVLWFERIFWLMIFSSVSRTQKKTIIDIVKNLDIFIVMDEIPVKYDPKETEDKWYDLWLKIDLFTPKLPTKKETYTIVMPPPNITGRLTLGHVLNNTIQDILIRYKKLSGFETLWVSGMDHAGIATQVVVEERLSEKGIKKEDLGREKFIEEVWKWKEEYAQAIRTQLKKMGCALDWTRECFTLSDDYSKKVIKVFVELYNKELIYRGERIINWCPRCMTALSDEQVETEERMEKLYYINYPIVAAKDFITVATTRPETMLGDTAVCVNPEDRRYQKLIGKKAVLPIMNREIPIIADNYVDPQFGTGALKVTPGHDPFDFELAKRHNLEFINIMNSDGTLNEKTKEFNGLDRFVARKNIVDKLKQTGLLAKIENYKVPLATCERCHTIIEPRLSKQWFVKMKPLAEPALKVVAEGKIKIYPKRWVNLYNHWLENVQDWCISRQIWWGHRIPVYYCEKCHSQDESLKGKIQAEMSRDNKGIIVSETKPEKCPFCGAAEIYQDEDVLDTWFSSWLWPFATLGWPEDTEDYHHFYPTQVLTTGWDIIYLWVARMIMAGLEFTTDIPFSNVIFHPMVRDEKGKKMSKSLGNSPEPMDLIEKYGADALRFGILLITPRDQDVLFSEKSIEVGRKFCNKLWNAARLIWLNFKNIETKIPDEPSIFDLWIIDEFNSLLKDIDYNFSRYELNAIAKRLYDFFWHTFCDWYLEFIKFEPYCKSNASKYLLKELLIILHPFMPFITEEIYQRFAEKEKSILHSCWPKSSVVVKSPKEIKTVINLIQEIRNIRGLFSINHQETLDIFINTNKELHKIIEENVTIIQKLCRIARVVFTTPPPIPVATIILPDLECYISLKGIDITKEKERLAKEIDFLIKRIDEIKYRLNNPQYLSKVREEIKQQEQFRLESFLKKKEAIQKAIEKL